MKNSILIFLLLLPLFAVCQLQIQAYDKQPVRYFITKNGKQVEISKEQADKMLPSEENTKSKFDIDSLNKFRKDFAPYGVTKSEFEYSLKLASLNAPIPNIDLTQFSYCDFSFVQKYLMDYVQTKLNWIVVDINKIKGEDVWVFEFANPGVFMGKEKQQNVIVKFYTFKDKLASDIIKKVVFRGSWDLLVEFYLQYWDTYIHISPNKKEICHNSFWQDRITLSAMDQYGKGEIMITNSEIKNEQEYEAYLINSISKKTIKTVGKN